jgi:hypothetical protein
MLWVDPFTFMKLSKNRYVYLDRGRDSLSAHALAFSGFFGIPMLHAPEKIPLIPIHFVPRKSDSASFRRTSVRC